MNVHSDRMNKKLDILRAELFEQETLISELRNEAERAKHALWEEKRQNKSTLGTLEEERGEAEEQLLHEMKSKEREL